jgi:glycosyltransferase involved in cell wall biosynthesis
MKAISIIIPTYNRYETLKRNLNLLAAQTISMEEFEVIVVDDGSSDETPRFLTEFAQRSPYALQVITQKNSGQGVARNAGIEKATGEILLFLGDDMLTNPDFLSQHLRFHTANPEKEKVCLGLVAWHPEIKPTHFMRWLITSGVQFKFSDLHRGKPADFHYFYTSNLSLKREFLGSERFDSSFHGWGFEDTELGYRLQQKGMQLIFHPEAVALHLHEITPDNLAERQFAAGKNAFRFAQLHPEAGILPSGLKLSLQKTFALLLPFTYYGKAKKAFLAGIAAARQETLK